MISTANAYAVPDLTSSDDVVVAIEGTLESSCYQLDAPVVGLTPQVSPRINIEARASLRSGLCPEKQIPWTQKVNLGRLPVGAYLIVTGLGVQPLRLDINPSEKSEYLRVAPVENVDVQINTERKKITAFVRGRLPANCEAVDHIAIKDHVHTVLLSPLLLSPCGTQISQENKPYSASIDIPWRKAGRYLLHVRSLDGQAVTQIFDVPER